MKHQVYDDRTNEILFESEDKFECITFIDNNYEDYNSDWEYIWIRDGKEEK